MNDLEEMMENVTWLAKADLFSPTLRFGEVSAKYRRKYIANLRDEQALFYFRSCVPSVEYNLCAAHIGFDMCSNDCLFREAEEANHTDTLVPLGLLPVAVDPGGNPLLLNVESGRLYHFLAGYVDGQFLSVYSAESGFGSIPLTKENVFKMAEARFDGFCSFFRHAREASMQDLIETFWRSIEEEDVELVTRIMSLGLDLDIRNEAGRDPSQEAESQGKPRLARMLRAYLDKRRDGEATAN